MDPDRPGGPPGGIAGEWTLEELPRRLEGSFFVHDVAARLRPERERWIPALRRLADSPAPPSPRTWLNAGLLLLHLGDSGGTAAIARAIENGDEWIRREGLAILLVPTAERAEPLVESLAPALEKLLADPSSWVGILAIRAAAAFCFPQLGARLRALLDHSDAAVRREAALALAECGEPSAGREALHDLLGGSTGPNDELAAIRSVIQGLSRSGRRDRGESLGLLAAYVRSRLGNGDNTVLHAVNYCLRALKDAQWIGLHTLLRKVLNAPSGGDWNQSICLQTLAERGEPDDLAAILDRFNDNGRRRWCRDAILDLARSGRLEPLLPALRSALGAEPDPEVLGWMVRALYIAGPPDREPLSRAIVDRLRPSERMTVRWAEEGIDPERAAAILTEEGVLPTFLAASVLAEVKADWSKDRGAEAAVQRLFHEARLLVFYDEEDTGRLVADHTQLLRWLAEASRGRLLPEAISQTPEPDSHEREDPVVLRFVHRGRARQIVARNLGDWLDTEAVVGAVNDLLESEGHAERFHRLPDGGQLRFFVFAPREGFLRAARRLHLPLWRPQWEKTR